ncbi:hypothetical protein ACA910_018792 [Epithemia clementina (nom. ined.)]
MKDQIPVVVIKAILLILLTCAVFLISMPSGEKARNRSRNSFVLQSDDSKPSMSMEQTQSSPSRQEELSQGIQRIYYINLDKNVRRRLLMETALSHVRPHVPYHRFPAIIGSANDSECRSYKVEPQRCEGISGLSQTVIQLMDTQNMTGISVVLEDDFAIASDLTKIQQAIDLVPDDWDIIRFLYFRREFGVNPLAFHRVNFHLESSTGNEDSHDLGSLDMFRVQLRELVRPGPANFVCSGTYAMVWRESSLPKLRQIWSLKPYRDIDCRLAEDPGLKSYLLGFQRKRTFKQFFGTYHTIEEPNDI